MPRQKTQRQINLTSIQPVASSPPKASQVQPPAPVPEFSNLDDLAPMSATLAKIAGHRKQQKEAEERPGYEAEGSLAFDQQEAGGIVESYSQSLETSRKSLEEGASYLTNPWAIDSYWRDAGISLATEAERRAKENWESIVPAFDDNNRPVEQPDPRQYFMEQTAELDEFVAGLHPEAQVAYDQRKSQYADGFGSEVGEAQTKAKEQHDFQLKADRYTGWLFDFADKGEFDEPDFSAYSQMTDVDWAQNFGKNREATKVAIAEAAKHAAAGDRHDRALNFLDAVVKGMELNGVPVSEDQNMMLMIEGLEDQYTESEDSKASTELRELTSNIKLWQGDLRQSWGARLREAQGNPVEVNALVEEMRAEVESDPTMSLHSEDIMDGMQKYGREFYEDEITADPKVVEALQEAIRTFDPSAIELIRAADIPPAMKDQLEQKARERGDQRQYHQGHPAYVGLENATQTQLNADLYSSNRSRVIQDFQRGIDKRRDALYSQAISEGLAAGVPDMHSYLEGKAAEIEEKFLPEIRAFEDEQERMRNTVEDKITDRLKRNVDASELIGQAYIEGHLDEAQRKALLDQNDLATDLDDKFFTNSQIFQDKLRELMSKVEAADAERLAELLVGGDAAQAMFASGPTAALELLQGRVERDFVQRGYEWLDENLETTEPNAQKRSWREALDLMVEEYEQRLFSDATKDKATEAEAILGGREEEAEMREDFATRFKESVLELAQTAEVYAQSYRATPAELASRPPSIPVPMTTHQMFTFPWTADGYATGQWKQMVGGHEQTYRNLLLGTATATDVRDAAYQTAVLITDNEDLTEDQKMAGLKDIVITSQLSPLSIVTGSQFLKAARRYQDDFTRAEMMGIQGKKTWYGPGWDDPAGSFRKLIEGTDMQESMDDFFSRTIEVPIEADEVDPMRHLIWHSESALEYDRKHRPKLFKATMDKLGIPEEQYHLVVQAQFNLIDKHYNHTDQ